MDKLLVHGGSELSGRINISGSKNASLPILAACLLTEEPCIIRRVPDVSDTNFMIQIMGALGLSVERSSGVVRTTCEGLVSNAPYELVRKMRASICVMGPLVARLGRAEVSVPGGCVIGDRPVDLHLKGLEGLGAEIQMEAGNMLMMAATLAEGTTVIESAAAEPEVEDLANFLNSMGAKITGAGTRTITIEGVEKLHGVEHTVIPDRIEAGTFMVAAAIAGCKEGVTLNRVCREHMIPTTDVLLETGHSVEYSEDGTTVVVKPGDNPVGGNIRTAPHPDFPTDMQAQFSALFATTPGISVIEDTIFPQRFMHCAEMTRMGANMEVDNGRVVIQGVEQLSGAPVMASDLRASAALVLAGLKAKGTTDISRLYHIDRGYEHIDEKLLMLGANVERVKE